MSDGVKFEINGIEEVIHNLESFPKKLKVALALDAQNVAKEMESWAKENASWEDRTSNARKFMQSHVKWTNADTLMISISHHVEYGIYLELCNECKYAILESAIKQFAPQFNDGWKKIVQGGLNI